MKKVITTALLLLLTTGATAQETVAVNTGEIISPEISADNTVAFRLFAPNAKQVQLEADFLPKVIVEASFGKMEANGKVNMTRDTNGVWTYRSDVVNPELHTYCFYVDGLRITDPNNVYMIRDIATYT